MRRVTSSSLLLVAVLAGSASAQLTRRMSVDSNGVEGNGASFRAAVSADGRYTAFESDASNLIAGGTNGCRHVFVRDRESGSTELVSIDTSEVQASANCYHPSISADGRYVAFESDATNLVAGDTNGLRDIFVRDRQGGTTERVSVSSSNAQGNGDSDTASISADGRYVAFESFATNLVGGDTNAREDIFVRDRLSGTTERVSVDSSGAQGSSSKRAVSD